jgi:hypothetical protein
MYLSFKKLMLAFWEGKETKMSHAHYLHTLEAEAGILQVWSQPRLCREILSQKIHKERKTVNNEYISVEISA